jgi:cyanophycin synthetase
VGEAIIDHLFTPGENARIPIVGVAGSRDTAEVARLVGWLMQLSGDVVGVACRHGLFVGNRRVESADAACWEAGQRLLINRNVEAAVFENGPLSIVTEGLAYDRCNIGIVTDTDAVPALEAHDWTEPEQRFKVLRTQVDVVRGDGAAVLNAADAQALAMAELCDGEVLLYAEDAALPELQSHVANGGRAVAREGSQVLLMHGSASTPVLDLSRDLRPAARHLPAAVVLAAVAAAWAQGLSAEQILAGVETFEPDVRP